ncbi:BAG family molecular chaperone regulator 8, chloroplastic isoform X2 [Humulus lupulus]|uniref:BAG family molecular chaperone regulator 8, chloroplastic isoform X2 n=1 Tax=Humulus lupulus TaxID=3486 RepID=UPI002B413C75|nr:BAG family molecular chaperone regulator 8, chloroplastic isoform X2 [Humulus lupulus]
MAAHHHHLHPPPPPPTCCGCSSGYDCSSNCDCNNTHFNQPHHGYPPSPSSIDPHPLLQVIASQVLQSTAQQPQLYSHYSKSRTHNRKLHDQSRHSKQRLHQQEAEETNLLISSLLSRIEVLETSLHRFSSDRSHYSLRDVAARVIQLQFRAFLVRRSRALRELKDLAVVKSAFTSLKSSISNETHFDFHSVSRKAMDLLVKLDSIQGDDSMVRDGKRSMSRDLVQFMDFIDGVALKRRELSIRARKNVRLSRNNDPSKVNLSKNGFNLDGDQREVIRKLRERVEKIRGYTMVPQDDDEFVEFEGFQHVSDEDNEAENPIVVISGKKAPIRNGVLANRSGDQPKVKKSVSFAENGNLFKVFSNSNEASSNEGDSTSTNSSDGHEEDGENNGADVEELKGFSLGTEDDEEEEGDVVGIGSSQTSNGERNPKTRSVTKGEVNYKIKGHNEEFVFSAPLPVQMDDKADLMKRRTLVKILRS